jgi:hypothetical protein
MDIKKAFALDNAAVIGSNLGMLFVMIRKYQIKWRIFPYVVFQTLGAFF